MNFMFVSFGDKSLNMDDCENTGVLKQQRKTNKNLQ